MGRQPRDDNTLFMFVAVCFACLALWLFWQALLRASGG